MGKKKKQTANKPQKVLYHYTCLYHLSAILESRFLKLTESNLRYPEEMYKPVVWLTDSVNPENNGLISNVVDKMEIKFTVEWKTHFQHWFAWSTKNNINPKWAEALTKGMNYKSWWISEKIIPLSDVIRIENTKTGQIYYDKESPLIYNPANFFRKEK